MAISGEAGVGKSRLLRELVGRAAGRGVPVLFGRAVESSASPYRPLSEALLSQLRRVDSPLGPGGDPFRSALGLLLPGWATEVPAGDTSVVVGEAVLRLLASVAGPGACLLALEDLHWADRETMAVVEYLADNVSDQRLLLVATVRDDEIGEPVRRVRALVARRSVSRVELRRLDPAGVQDMAAACLQEDAVPAPLRDLVLSGADGLPFLVEELLLAAETAVPQRTPVPETFAEMARRRLRAAPGVAEVLRAAAVLGRDFDEDLLPVMTGLSSAEVARRLRAAREHRLIELDSAGGCRFRHALTRATVLADLLPGEHVALAAVALPAVEAAHPGLPGHWCELAADLADRAGMDDRAAALFLEAGRRALGRGALVTARGFLDRARQLGADDPTVALEADDALCTVLALAGDNATLAEVGDRLLGELTAADATRTRTAAVHRRLARAAVAAADWRAAREHLDAAADDTAADGEDDVLAAQVALGLGDLEAAVRLARSALSAAEQHGRWALACEALEVIGRRERVRDLVAAEQAFSASLAIAERAASPVWRVRAMHELGTIDLLAGGPIDRLAAARAAALSAGAMGAAATVGLQMAAWRLNHAEVDETVRAAREFAAEAHRLRLPTLEALGAVLEAGAHALAGRRTAMDVALATALRLAGEDPEVRGVAALQVRAAYWLVRENRARALADLDAGMDLLRRTPVTAPFRGMWALIRVMENKDGAAAVAEVEASGLTVYWLVHGWVVHARAVLLGRAGRTADAAAAFAKADQVLGRCRWYQEYARRLVAEAALADGWGDPVEWLTGALDFFDRSGDARVASACRALLRGAGAPVPRQRRAAARVPAGFEGLGLTPRETEVIVLLGQALPTRDIAARLFLSPKTVERHVANLAAKVGVRGRAELIAFAASRISRGDQEMWSGGR